MVHGSKVLPRNGYRLHTWDARGHGESDPAPEYDYDHLADDLEAIVDDRASGGPVVVGGHSMGCHTAVNFALRDPGRVVGPDPGRPGVHRGGDGPRHRPLGRTRRRPRERRAGRVRAGDRRAGRTRTPKSRKRSSAWPSGGRSSTAIPRRSRTLCGRFPVETFRLARPARGARRCRPWSSPATTMPTTDIRTRSPLSTPKSLPDAEMISEEKGESPLSWQGGRLSREIARFLAGHGLAGR